MTVYLRTVNFFRSVKYPVIHRDKFDLDMITFEQLINTYEYKADPLGGAIDIVGDPDRFFDSKIKYNRDCDNWAFLWSLWGRYHNYLPKEWVICNPKKPFKTMHVITTLEDPETKKVFLMNYQHYGPFQSEDKALAYMAAWESYKEDRVIVFSRTIPKDPRS